MSAVLQHETAFGSSNSYVQPGLGDLQQNALAGTGYFDAPAGLHCAAAFGLPASYGADKTQNYELGIKGDLASRTLSYDVSVYLIDWKDIQLILVDPTTRAGYYTNERL